MPSVSQQRIHSCSLSKRSYSISVAWNAIPCHSSLPFLISIHQAGLAWSLLLPLEECPQSLNTSFCFATPHTSLSFDSPLTGFCSLILIGGVWGRGLLAIPKYLNRIKISKDDFLMPYRLVRVGYSNVKEPGSHQALFYGTCCWHSKVRIM